MHSSWHDLAWNCYTSFFTHSYQSCGPWFTSKFRFRSISWELTDIFSPNFIYAFILTRSSLGLLHFIFQKFVPELWPFMPKFCFRSISWEQIGRIFPNFIYAFILARSSLGLLHVIFHTFVPELWPLIYVKFRFRSISWTNWQNFTKFYICIHIDKIFVGIVTHHFSHICTRVMALELHQNFVSCQYLENKWIEFHQILYMHSYWQVLCWVCYTSFFSHFYQSNDPWFTPKFHFRSISQILTKLYITIYTDKIYVGIVRCHFSQICKRVMALDWCKNYFTTQYSETLWPFTACKALQRGYSQILWQF